LHKSIRIFKERSAGSNLKNHKIIQLRINPVMNSDIPPKYPLVRGSLAEEEPLCVDLDGTLILTDVLWESAAQLISNPFVAIRTPGHCGTARLQ
jgi:hypothetical protein